MHGVRSIGNYGFGRSILRIRNWLQPQITALQLIQGKGLPFRYPKAIALNSIKEYIVLDAILSTRVLNAKVLIVPNIVIFVHLQKNHSPVLDALPSPHLPTPVKITLLTELLRGYPSSIINILISGLSCGFPLHYQGNHRAFEASNLLSALENPQVVDMKLSKELAACRIVGPFTSPPFPSFRVSPLGVVPKKVQGDFRLIRHLSFPKGRSVNDGIAAEDTSVRYATIADAIRLIKLAGPGCFLAKTDIKSAFRIIPIHPNDYPLLGMKWRGRFYYDRCMPMGCSSSCKTFETFSTAVEWIARHKQKIDKILHLLDDFIRFILSYTMPNLFRSLSNLMQPHWHSLSTRKN